MPRSTSIIPAGEPWMGVVCRGQTFRIVDVEGNQAVDTLFFNAANSEERYSAPDTVRSQGRLYLTTGTQLLSNDGNVMLTITADTCGRHDTLGGACSAESNTVRYALEKRHMHSCRDNFLLALARSGIWADQARPAVEHQFLHERAGDACRQAHVCGRCLGGGPLRRDAGRDGRDRPDLELPAAQQPLQRL